MVRLHDPDKMGTPRARTPRRWYESSIAVNDAVALADRGPSGTFVAKYGGRCGACGESYGPGDRLRYASSDVVVHEGCEDADVVAGRETEEIQGMGPRQIAKIRANLCGSCFLELLPSGGCGTCDA